MTVLRIGIVFFIIALNEILSATVDPVLPSPKFDVDHLKNDIKKGKLGVSETAQERPSKNQLIELLADAFPWDLGDANAGLHVTVPFGFISEGDAVPVFSTKPKNWLATTGMKTKAGGWNASPNIKIVTDALTRDIFPLPPANPNIVRPVSSSNAFYADSQNIPISLKPQRNPFSTATYSQPIPISLKPQRNPFSTATYSQPIPILLAISLPSTSGFNNIQLPALGNVHQGGRRFDLIEKFSDAAL